MTHPSVVVTGGAGFLGSHLCERLLAMAYRVTCLDNFLTGRPENVTHPYGHARFRMVEVDVTEYRSGRSARSTLRAWPRRTVRGS